jgi:DNA-binding CsgD family transcriptional regulator
LCILKVEDADDVPRRTTVIDPVGQPVTCPVVVGRAPVVEGLRRLLDDGHHRARVALLSGEAGMGKSRLVAEAKGYAAERGYLVFEGGCFPQDRACPYAPLLDLIRTRFAADPPDSVARHAGAYARELQPLLPELFSSAVEDGDGADRDPDQARRRLFEGLTHLLIDDLGDRPLLLVVEDLHWCDEASLDVLRHLLRRTAGRPVLLIGTYRSDEADAGLRRWLGDLDRERLAQEYPLGPLARDDVAAMLRAVFDGGGTVPASFIDAIDALAEGNPFFVEEFAGSLIAASGGRAAESLAQLAAVPGHDWRIPRSVHACVVQRVLRIGPVAREVLRLAAVVGRRFDYALLERLAGLDERTLVGLIKEMVSANLVVEESPEVFTFRHALIQQAVYGELLGRERIALHRMVAEYAEEVFDDSTEQHLPDLAYHFFQAEMWDKALVYARRAGEQASRLYAPRAAVEQFTRALEAARRLRSVQGDDSETLIASLRPGLHSGRGRAYETLGDFDAARADYEAAVVLAQAAGDTRAEWQGLLDLGLLWAGRDYTRGGPHFEAALALARAIDDPALIARSLNRLGNWQVNTSEPWQAIVLHREALTLFERLDDQRGIAETLDLLGVASYLSADLSGSIAYLERAVSMFREMDDRHALVSSLAMLAVRASFYELDTLEGDARNALAGVHHAEESLQIARAIGWRAGEAFALFQRGFALAPLGEYARALESAEQSLRLADEIGHAQWQAGAHTAHASLYLDLLSTDDARRHAERALSLAHSIGSSFWIPFATSLLALACLLNGDIRSAEGVLARLPDSEPEAPIRSLGRWRRTFARVHLALAQDRPAEALSLIDQAAGRDLAEAGTGETPSLTLLRADALIRLSQFSDAEAALVAVKAAATRAGVRPLLWRAHVALGNLYRLRSEQDEARREYSAARTIIEELAANIPDGRLRETFLQKATALLPRSYRLSQQRVSAAQSGGLTARERQVAALIGRGMSNREIAASLVLGERTVETHVSNILGKLGAGSRQEVAAWVASQNLDADI